MFFLRLFKRLNKIESNISCLQGNHFDVLVEQALWGELEPTYVMKRCVNCGRFGERFLKAPPKE